MERHDDQNDTIELGTASLETKGGFGMYSDIALKQDTPGLSND